MTRHHKQKNAPGQKFAMLTLERRHERKRGGHTWVARCDCGDRLVAAVRDIRSGHTKSCGCASSRWKADGKRTHGREGTSEYRTWSHMKGRCYTPTDAKFQHYGGRGITVCERWLNSFENFLSDMGERPPGLTLDRIDTNGNYEPGNCRWATPLVQSRNRRFCKAAGYR